MFRRCHESRKETEKIFAKTQPKCFGKKSKEKNELTNAVSSIRQQYYNFHPAEPRKVKNVALALWKNIFSVLPNEKTLFPFFSPVFWPLLPKIISPSICA